MRVFKYLHSQRNLSNVLIFSLFVGVYIIVVMGFASLSVVSAVGVSWMHNQGVKGRQVPKTLKRVCLYLNKWVHVPLATPYKSRSSRPPSMTETTLDMKTPLVQTYSSVNLTYRNNTSECYNVTTKHCDPNDDEEFMVIKSEKKPSSPLLKRKHAFKERRKFRSNSESCNNTEHNNHKTQSKSKKHRTPTMTRTSDDESEINLCDVKKDGNPKSAVVMSCTAPTDNSTCKHTHGLDMKSESLTDNKMPSPKHPQSPTQYQILSSLNLILRQQEALAKKMESQIVNTEWQEMAEIVDRTAFWFYLFMTVSVTVVILLIVPLGKTVKI